SPAARRERPPSCLPARAGSRDRPQTDLPELAELIDELEIALVDRLVRDRFERIAPVYRLRGLALRGQHRAEFRDEFFQIRNALSHVGLPAVDIPSKASYRQKNVGTMFRLYERADSSARLMVMLPLCP